MYGPKLEMIRGYIWPICGTGMDLIWATTPHIIPIHYIAFVQHYGKYRKLALIHVCHIFLCGNDMGGQVQHHMVSSYGKCMGLSAVLSP